MTAASSQTPPTAAALGYAGALPFVGCAAAIWLADPKFISPLIVVLATYGAIILSFMGGARWGLAMREGHPGAPAAFIISVLPAILAWGALMLSLMVPSSSDFVVAEFGEQNSDVLSLPVAATPIRIAQLGLLAVAFLVLLWSDIRTTREGHAPGWYAKLRIPLTVLVVGSLVLALLRILV